MDDRAIDLEITDLELEDAGGVLVLRATLRNVGYADAEGVRVQMRVAHCAAIDEMIVSVAAAQSLRIERETRLCNGILSSVDVVGSFVVTRNGMSVARQSSALRCGRRAHIRLDCQSANCDLEVGVVQALELRVANEGTLVARDVVCEIVAPRHLRVDVHAPGVRVASRRRSGEAEVVRLCFDLISGGDAKDVRMNVAAREVGEGAMEVRLAGQRETSVAILTRAQARAHVDMIAVECPDEVEAGGVLRGVAMVVNRGSAACSVTLRADAFDPAWETEPILVMAGSVAEIDFGLPFPVAAFEAGRIQWSLTACSGEIRSSRTITTCVRARAHLVLERVSLTPRARIGGAVTLEAVILNDGNASAHNVVFDVSQAELLVREGLPVPSIAHIAAGERTEVRCEFLAAHEGIAEVMFGARWADDGIPLGSATVTIAREPHIVVDICSRPPNDLRLGDAIEWLVSIANDGDADARDLAIAVDIEGGAFVAGSMHSGEFTLLDTQCETRSDRRLQLASLSPNQRLSIEFSTIVTSAIPTAVAVDVTQGGHVAAAHAFGPAIDTTTDDDASCLDLTGVAVIRRRPLEAVLPMLRIVPKQPARASIPSQIRLHIESSGGLYQHLYALAALCGDEPSMMMLDRLWIKMRMPSVILDASDFEDSDGANEYDLHRSLCKRVAVLASSEDGAVVAYAMAWTALLDQEPSVQTLIALLREAQPELDKLLVRALGDRAA